MPFLMVFVIAHEIHCWPSYPLPLLQGHFQELRSWTPCTLGAEKRDQGCNRSTRWVLIRSARHCDPKRWFPVHKIQSISLFYRIVLTDRLFLTWRNSLFLLFTMSGPLHNGHPSVPWVTRRIRSLFAPPRYRVHPGDPQDPDVLSWWTLSFSSPLGLSQPVQIFQKGSMR